MNDTRRTPRRRVLRWVVIGAVAVVALGAGVIAWYVLTNDAPDPLDEQDLTAALTETTAVGTGVDTTADTTADTTGTTDDPGGSGTIAPAPGDTAPPGSTSGQGGAADGTWEATDASVVRYRVDEILFGANTTAVGETNAITGTLVVSGPQVTEAEFQVDMSTVESDRDQRDNQFRGRIMDVEQFPTATFTLTQPIDLGAVPADGEQITATANGELTLRGVTNPVTFEVTAQQEGERIGVLGSIPVLFADYDIPNPSFAGIETEDNGVLEFVLVFERA